MLTMRAVIRWLSAGLCVCALVALSVLLISVVSHHLGLSSLHQKTGALAFILIGTSFVVLQFRSRRPFRDPCQIMNLAMRYTGNGYTCSCFTVSAA